MYFTNRTTAGQQLAAQLTKYRYENAVVVAIGEPAVLVAREIAAELHGPLLLMALADVVVPGENITFGTLNHSGEMAYNPALSDGQRDEYYSEFRGAIEDGQRQAFSAMNRLLSDGGYVQRDLVRYQTVILVSDGLREAATVEAAVSFFRPVKLERLVLATPLASVAAVDRMHILADELHCLSVTDNYLDTDHYYDDNHLPDHAAIIAILNQNVLNWR